MVKSVKYFLALAMAVMAPLTAGRGAEANSVPAASKQVIIYLSQGNRNPADP